MVKRASMVIYCAKCGHSHYDGQLLAEGEGRCLAPINTTTSIGEWREIAMRGRLSLTCAGRAALAEESGRE